MKAPSAFRRSVVVTLVALMGGSLVAAMLAGVFGEPPAPTTAGTNAFSKSAIGHKALVQLLEEWGVPVVVSRFESAERAKSSDAMLMVMEPQVVLMAEDPEAWGEMEPEADPEDAVTIELQTMLETADVAIVVLPKRIGFVDEDNPEHIGSSSLLYESDVTATLDALGISGLVVRTQSETPDWHTSGLGSEPEVDDLQVIDSYDVDPIISTEEGALFGRVETYSNDVYVVSDPDIFATHGIVRGDNAAVALAIINYARGNRTVVIDETIHGFVIRPSLSRELMRFPLVLAVVQVLLVAMLAIWAGAQRFGAPRDPALQEPGGPRAIIDNTAAVLEHSGHAGNAVARYLQMAISEVGKKLHAPQFRDYAARIAWLRETGKTHGVKTDIETLRERVHLLGLEHRADKREAELLSLRIYLWKQEMIHGQQRGQGALRERV